MFDWNEFLVLARSLNTGAPPTEACLRSAISRAYYAAFHHASEYCKKTFATVVTGTGTDHGTVWRELKTSRDRKQNEAGTQGDRLLRSRRDADYSANASITVTTASMAIGFADKVIRNL